MAFNSIGGSVTATPNIAQNATTTNFTSLVDFSTSALLPDIYADQVHRYGNRTLSGFLKAMGAEYALASDEVRWTEQGRLHLRYTGTRAASVVTITGGAPAGSTHGIREGNTVLMVDTSGDEVKAIVTATTDGAGGDSTNVGTFTFAAYAAIPTSFGLTGLTIIVTGSEFAKGTGAMAGSLETAYTNRSNNPIIFKDHFAVNGSDAAQIGWIEVTDENGGGHGYLWYLQSEIDTRTRFMDQVEIGLLEGVLAVDGQAAQTLGFTGTDGLFAVLQRDGNTAVGGFDDSNAAEGRESFDQIVRRLDQQGNIQENMLYLNREESLAVDNILAQQNGAVAITNTAPGHADGAAVPADTTAQAAGTSWGAFSNNPNMALNLGFTGWKRGSYSFYKTDWKYLNDYVGRGAIVDTPTSGVAQANIQGVLVPAGSSSVYDQIMSGTVKRPMLHVRYRATEGENRKLKNWVTGSVGGVYTSADDRMDVHYLSERCLVTQAPNNFFIFNAR